MNLFLALTLPPMAIAVLAAIACALPANFLILRRQALMGDAISHVVLPGIVLAFILTGRLSAWAMMGGAALSAMVSVLMIEAIRRIGRVEPGAAMGVIFTTLFAAGVLLLEQSDTASVHLDVEHALMGNVESLVWLSATDWGSLVDGAALSDMPPPFFRLVMMVVIIAAMMRLFWKELVIATFDPVFATSSGIPQTLTGYGLPALVAAAAIAAFEAVGSILVIAMFVCPPATARLVTNRLSWQVGWSAVFAAISAIAGFLLAESLPTWLGHPQAVSAAGMIAVVSGVMLGVACLLGPARHRGPASATG